MEAKILEGRKIAARIKEELKKEIESLRSKGRVLSLSSILVGEDPGARVYVKSQKKACEEIGIEYNLHEFPLKVKEEEVLSFIKELNKDPKVTGIILQMPLPPGLEGRKLQWSILPEKDVEGVTPPNLGKVVYGESTLSPCTALAVMELLEETKINLYGKEAVMVGHSDIVGKPVALFLLKKFATTCVCHIGTGERGVLPEHVKRAEILIVAVGKAEIIRGKWIREGAIVIDVGINRVGGKIVGDVEFEEAKKRASWITPVPGGVGPVTTSMLLKNVVEAAKRV